MFFTADQLVAHAVGDYLLQSDWMATEKVRRSVAALAHVLTYVLPFLLLTTSFWAILAIVVSHFVIDRWRLARYVVWAKNFLSPWRLERSEPSDRRPAEVVGMIGPGGRRLAPTAPPWSRCTATGYDEDRPAWLTVWLMIVADNTLHVLCNGAALRWLA